MKALTKQNLLGIITSTANSASSKFGFGFTVTLYSFLFDPLKTQLYFAIAALIIFDFVTAIAATAKTKDKITSARASRTLVKLFVYAMLISAATLVDKFVLQIGQVFADLTMGFVAVTEFISIIENIGKMGYAIPKQALKKLKEFRGEQ